MKKVVFFILFVTFFLSIFLSFPVLSRSNLISSSDSSGKSSPTFLQDFRLKITDPSFSDLFFSSSKRKSKNSFLSENFNLKIKGKKVIGIKYTHFDYLSPQARKEKPSSTVEINQKLQFSAKGSIGDRITVNVNYDDTAPRSEQQKINLVYRGRKNDIIQEVALGDIKLALPKTEFTSYNKSLFGARLKAKWKDFYLTGIGSVTRGISEVKTFTGKTTTEEKEIPDTAYTKRTYFKVFFDQMDKYPPEFFGPFSYTQGTVEVWIDDQNGTNNVSGVTTHMTVIGEPVNGATDTYTGYFDLQYPGQDYTVDYSKGIIKFNKSIGEQYVIALAYKDADGNRHPASGYRMIMKGPDDKYYKYRLWDYYYLGSQRISQDGFVLQIKDLSDNIVYDWENPDRYPDYKVNVDFDFGIAQVVKPTSPVTAETYYKPFPDAYPPDSLHRYTIYTRYTHSVGVYLLHPDIVPESERVYVNGKLLTRDKDYLIDYSSGYLSFVDPNLIGSDTKIRVEYEWMPIMGGQATFMGGRIEYKPGRIFSLGSTFLSQNASPADKIPPLGLSPASHKVWEADLNLNFRPNLGSLWKGNFPLGILFTGELSHSNINPNTFGAGMLEDFSTSKVEDPLPLGKDSWRLGSQPPDVDFNLRDKVTISDERIKAEDVNPSWSSNEITVLKLTYDFTGTDNWDSVTCPISPVGKDYSHMKYLEVWVKGIPDDVKVYLDIGIVNEDVDGDGILDTEDVNGDGILNPGEDTGIMLGDRLIGKDNGRLDTEDLDGDGILDTTENFSTYLLSSEYKKEFSTGWCKYTIPLSDYISGSTSWDSVKNLVKDIRIWVKGSNWSGTIEFARITTFGDRWQKSNVEVKGVNNYDDPDFPNPFDSPEFRSYYERMYKSTKTSEGKWKKESALSLLPISGDTSGYIQQTFISARDFSNYRQINFWIYQSKGEGNFYLKFGQDVETNYYSYTTALSSVTCNQWVKIQIPFSQLEIEGSPSFSEIKQIRIGFDGVTTCTPIYIDDIYLTGVSEKNGWAQRYIVRTNFSRFLTLTTEYKKINPPFSVIGSSSTNNKLELKKWSARLSLFSFLPISYSRSDEFTSTLSTNGINLHPVETDKVSKISHSYQVAFYLPSWPRLVFKGSNVKSNYLSRQPLEKTSDDTYDLSLNYSLPLHFFLLPTNISSSLQLKKSGKQVQGVSKTLDTTRKGSINLPFRLARNMILTTSYSQSDTEQKIWGEGKMPKSRSKDLSLQSRISVFGLNPSAKFKGGYKEENFSSSNPYQRKISTYLEASYNLPFRPSSFFKRFPALFSNLTYYTSFNLKREGIFEDTTAHLDLASQFGLKRLSLPDGWEKLWLEKRSFSLKQRWHPFFFIDTTVGYSRQEEDKTEMGTPFVTEVENWPSAQFKFDLNKTPVLIDRLSRKLFSSSNLVLGYSRKKELKREISTTYVYQPSLNWRGIFKKPESLYLTYSYKSSSQYERFAGQSSSSEEFSSTHKLKVDYSTYLPWGRRIPFLNRIINFKNRVTLSTTLNREFKYEKDSSGTLREDNEKWTLGTDISYRLRENVNMKLGISAAWYKDKVKAGEDYFSYGGSAQVEIVF